MRKYAEANCCPGNYREDPTTGDISVATGNGPAGTGRIARPAFRTGKADRISRQGAEQHDPDDEHGCDIRSASWSGRPRPMIFNVREMQMSVNIVIS